MCYIFFIKIGDDDMSSNCDNLWILVVIELIIFAVVLLIKFIFQLWETRKFNRAMKYLKANVSRKTAVTKALDEYKSMDESQKN